MYDKLFAICRGLSRRFPEGNSPYQIMTRLLEESGELAKEVNHFEGSGVKNEKYGIPDKVHLVKEIRQTVCCVLQVAIYYSVEDELKADIDNYFRRLKAEGWIND
jgi:NTP pyrophosphatase (non-canonical NTP hydrolase)